MTLAEVMKMAQAAEMGKSTHKHLSNSGMLCRLSDHQKSKGAGQQKKFEGKDKKHDGKDQGGGTCRFCGHRYHQREDCPAKDTKCRSCDQKGHFAAKCFRKGKGGVKEIKETEDSGSVNTVSEDFFSEVGELNRLSVSSMTEEEFGVELSPWMVAKLGESNTGTRKSEPVGHHNCDQLGRWRRGQVEPHGRVSVRVQVCAEAYRQMDRELPSSSRSTVVSGLADTGAQMCLTG